jgi:hypothetical protein
MYKENNLWFSDLIFVIFVVQQSFLFATVEMAYLKYMNIKANEICKVANKTVWKYMQNVSNWSRIFHGC